MQKPQANAAIQLPAEPFTINGPHKTIIIPLGKCTATPLPLPEFDDDGNEPPNSVADPALDEAGAAYRNAQLDLYFLDVREAFTIVARLANSLSRKHKARLTQQQKDAIVHVRHFGHTLQKTDPQDFHAAYMMPPLLLRKLHPLLKDESIRRAMGTWGPTGKTG